MDLMVGVTPLDSFSTEHISLMFSEARRSGVLARLSELQLSSQRSSAIPNCLRSHQISALVHAEAFRRDVLRELVHIERALSQLRTPVVLLKGAAYVAMDMGAAKGRVFSDIDILVTKSQVGPAEGALMLNGWIGGKLDPYDQRYYRQWSHEIPPMTHPGRGTTIDLHHSLVMPTCRVRVDSKKMLEQVIPVEGSNFWWRLKNEDMVLHAVSHLMLNSEFERGFRDLWDIDLLFRQFSGETENFMELLMERALEVGLGNMLKQALFLARRFFGTPIPDWVVADTDGLFVRLVGCAASTRHSDTKPNWQGVADALLSYREMYLRLPNHLLFTHMAHKAAQLFNRSRKQPIDQV